MAIYQPLKFFSYETVYSLRILGDPVCIIHLAILRANYANMIQILRAVIITTDGVIVQDYAEVATELGLYLVSDLEAERRYIADCYTSQGYTVKRVNLMYISK